MAWPRRGPAREGTRATAPRTGPAGPTPGGQPKGSWRLAGLAVFLLSPSPTKRKALITNTRGPSIPSASPTANANPRLRR